jgi:hypothetical protein
MVLTMSTGLEDNLLFVLPLATSLPTLLIVFFIGTLLVFCYGVYEVLWS